MLQESSAALRMEEFEDIDVSDLSEEISDDDENVLEHIQQAQFLYNLLKKLNNSIEQVYAPKLLSCSKMVNDISTKLINDLGIDNGKSEGQ